MRDVKYKSVICITIILLIVQIYCQINKIVIYGSLIKPITWALFCIYLIYLRINSYKRFSESRKYVQKMIFITIFYYILWFYIGIVFGFGISPYSRKIFNVLRNIVEALIPIVCIEISRSLVINDNKDRNKIVVIFYTIVLILVETNFYILIDSFSYDRETAFKYFAQVIMPLIASSCIYSYLVCFAGEKMTLIFRTPKIVFTYLLPILPDMNWFLEACLGIIIPVLFYVLYQYIFPRKNRTVRIYRRNNKILVICALVFSVLLVSFMLGVFKYEPVTIVSNSMKPTYARGDVIIYEKLSADDLKKIEKNSIIIYRIGNQAVAHRVVSVIKENGSVKYQTQGDANNGPDHDLVGIDQIIGVYKFHIKSIGYPSVWLNDFFNEEESKVETK